MSCLNTSQKARFNPLGARAACAAMAFAVLVFARPAFADSLSGVVLDRSDIRVPNVDVSIACRRSSGRTTSTDDSGYFEFHGLKQGDRCKLEVHWGRDLVFRDYYEVSRSRHIEVNL